jgi:hypothetical protein
MKYNLVGIMYGGSRKQIPNFVPIILKHGCHGNTSSTEMDFHQFLCYYCGVGFDSLQNVLDHTCDFHGNMVLKVKSLEQSICKKQNKMA